MRSTPLKRHGEGAPHCIGTILAVYRPRLLSPENSGRFRFCSKRPDQLIASHAGRRGGAFAAWTILRRADFARMGHVETFGEVSMPRLDREGVKIYYEVHGDGPALILTHGYSSTSAMWQGQIAALSRHHKLILWDMR